MVASTKVKGNIARTQKTASSVKVPVSTASAHILSPLQVSKSEKLATYKKRRDQYLYESISPADTEKYETSGWILHKESKTRVAKRKDDRITQTHQDIIKLNKDLSDYITTALKVTYGNGEEESGEKAWWEQGIESQKAKRNAYERFLEGSKDNKKLPKEAYLDLLDYKDIVKQKNNWANFSPVFNIPLPGEKGKTYYLDWLDQLNKLRRVAAHPTGVRGYDESDYEFIKFIKYEFYKRLGVATGKAEEL